MLMVTAVHRDPCAGLGLRETCDGDAPIQAVRESAANPSRLIPYGLLLPGSIGPQSHDEECTGDAGNEPGEQPDHEPGHMLDLPVEWRSTHMRQQLRDAP
jgi:hypothetical protein